MLAVNHELHRLFAVPRRHRRTGVRVLHLTVAAAESGSGWRSSSCCSDNLQTINVDDLDNSERVT